MVVTVQEGVERDGDPHRIRMLEKDVHGQPGCQTSGREKAHDQKTGTVPASPTSQGGDSLSSPTQVQPKTSLMRRCRPSSRGRNPPRRSVLRQAVARMIAISSASCEKRGDTHVPALGYRILTPLYDVVSRTFLPEQAFQTAINRAGGCQPSGSRPRHRLLHAKPAILVKRTQRRGWAPARPTAQALQTKSSVTLHPEMARAAAISEPMKPPPITANVLPSFARPWRRR